MKLFVPVFLAALVAASPALADVPPPDTQGCDGKVAGNACNTDESVAGACKDSTCTVLDYSMGTPPVTKDVPCLVCDDALQPTNPPPKSGCSIGTASAGALGGLWLAAVVALRLRRRSVNDPSPPASSR
jgi:hypothetical protein